MKRILKLTVAIVVGLALCISEASADTYYTFSFANVYGTTEGIVTGAFTVPHEGVASAENFWITSSPFSTSPINVTSWADQWLNEFTTKDGVVLSGGFAAQDGPKVLYLNGWGFNILTLDNFVSYAWGENGLNAANFIDPPAQQGPTNAVPEPSSILLIGLGLIGIAGIKRSLQKIC
jgi:hypothetical protein